MKKKKKKNAVARRGEKTERNEIETADYVPRRSAYPVNEPKKALVFDFRIAFAFLFRDQRDRGRKDGREGRRELSDLETRRCKEMSA